MRGEDEGRGRRPLTGEGVEGSGVSEEQKVRKTEGKEEQERERRRRE